MSGFQDCGPSSSIGVMDRDADHSGSQSFWLATMSANHSQSRGKPQLKSVKVNYQSKLKVYCHVFKKTGNPHITSQTGKIK